MAKVYEAGLALNTHRKAQSFSCHAAWCICRSFQGMDIGDPGIQRGAAHRTGGRWIAALCFGQTASRPLLSWSPGVGRAGMACFSGGCRPRAVWRGSHDLLDRFAPGAGGAGPSWQRLAGRLRGASPQPPLAALEPPLAPALAGASRCADPAPSLAQIGRHWVRRWPGRNDAMARQPRRTPDRTAHQALQRPLAAQMAHAGENRGARCLPACNAIHAGLPLDLAALACRTGFADQTHHNPPPNASPALPRRSLPGALC